MSRDGRRELKAVQAMLDEETVRVELHPVLALSQGALSTPQAATLYTRASGRWVKAKLPMILAPEAVAQTRAAVLRTLADIIEANG